MRKILLATAAIAIITAMLPVSARSANGNVCTAGSTDPLCNPEWKQADIDEPPARFDHAHPGKVIVVFDGPFREDGVDLWGYIDLVKDPDGGKIPACVMHLSPVGATIGNQKLDDSAADILYIHERGHCGGWRHSGKGKTHINPRVKLTRLPETAARSKGYNPAKIKIPPDEFDHAYAGGMQMMFDGPFEQRRGSTDMQPLGTEKVYQSEMEPAWAYSYYDHKAAKGQPLCVVHLSPVGSVIKEQTLDDNTAHMLFLNQRAICNGWSE